MEWPPRSGVQREFPEVDRAEWFDPDTARLKVNPAQVAFVDRLLESPRPLIRGPLRAPPIGGILAARWSIPA